MASENLLWVEQSRYGIRETTEGVRKIIPELKLVGHVNYHTARPSFFNKHQHPDVLEIFYITRGKVSWWVEGVSHEVLANELFLVWPRELHGARHDVVEPSEYYWIQVHLPSLRRALAQDKANPITKLLGGIAERKFIGTPSLLSLYQALLKEHERTEVFAESVTRETLHLVLALVLRSSQASISLKPEGTAYQARLTTALNWAKEHVAEATTQEMVQVSGLDQATFQKQFCALVGSSPMQYLIRLRLQNSKEQLARGLSITEVAHQLGFSSSQYFATVFRKYEGLSPSDYVTKVSESGVNSEQSPPPLSTIGVR